MKYPDHTAVSVLLLALGTVHVFAAPAILPDKITPAIADKQDFQSPAHVHLLGWVGGRIQASESNRLAQLDTARLLEGYRHRPGRQAWDGEHVGKWLHAGTLAWVNSGDEALRHKLDFTVAELIKCQLPDGYLGTYLDKDRWTEWDVWSHKYNLLGLITYMRFTCNREPLDACRRMADLLCATFGEQPGQRDILAAGHHVGMAPTSVLEPMALLYRMTGEPRYLEFCRYILRSWERPKGPKIISTLLTKKRVDKVGNGKAYEMLSCLNGALEFYRTTGEKEILDACLNAWQDIVDHRLYLTGAASYNEVFHDNYDLPNVSNVGETCVTVTWLQFNTQLLRLTGEARFAEQLEHVILNQLLGAQRCDGAAWGYYVQMSGSKPYSSNLDGHCCLSSGPRGLALIPTFAATTDADGAVVNLYESGRADLSLRDHSNIGIETATMYPGDGRIGISITRASKKSLMLKLRVPAWCRSALVQVNGSSVTVEPAGDGYLHIARKWRSGDVVTLRFHLEARVIVGDHKNEGSIALMYGPLVLAADEAMLEPAGLRLDSVAAAGGDLNALDVQVSQAPERFKYWPGAKVFRINGILGKDGAGMAAGTSVPIWLAPFADAGQTGSAYEVWVPLAKHTN